MIENKNYLFIHVPRTAGSSLGYVLHTALNGNRIYDIHSSFSELENTCPKRVKNKFKFGFVRNPFEREFSQWLYHAYKPEFLVTPTFEEWITWRYSDYKMPKSFIAKGHDAYNYLKQFSVLPQIGFFLDKENNYKLDFLGNFESREKDLDFIFSKIYPGYNWREEYPHEEGQRNRAIECKDYKDHYTLLGKEIIEKAYSVDLKALGYCFDQREPSVYNSLDLSNVDDYSFNSSDLIGEDASSIYNYRAKNL